MTVEQTKASLTNIQQIITTGVVNIDRLLKIAYRQEFNALEACSQAREALLDIERQMVKLENQIAILQNIEQGQVISEQRNFQRAQQARIMQLKTEIMKTQEIILNIKMDDKISAEYQQSLGLNAQVDRMKQLGDAAHDTLQSGQAVAEATLVAVQEQNQRVDQLSNKAQSIQKTTITGRTIAERIGWVENKSCITQSAICAVLIALVIAAACCIFIPF